MLKQSLLFGAVLMTAVSLSHGAENQSIGVMIPADEMQWQEVRPGSPARIVILWGDRTKGEYGMLLKLPAGFSAPIHAHTGDYHGVSLSGMWRHSFDGGEERILPPGSYVLQPGLGMHGDACMGPEDCIVFIHQYVKGDFIPKQ
jgi:Domain of unknown function (DUF4437)